MTITSAPPYVCGKHIWIDDDGRTVTVEHGHEKLQFNLIQWTKEPLSLANPYFQVELQEELAPTQICMIGTNPNTDLYPPSWNLHRSCRYNSNDGGVFTDGKGQKTFRPYGNKGDTILVYLEHVTQDKCLLNFFLNTKFVYRQWVHVNSDNLYPAIGFNNGRAKFKVTWPGSGKQFDFDQSLVSNWLGHPAISKDNRSNRVKCREHIPAAILSIQAPRPLERGHPYFEVELLENMNPEACPAIGLTSAVSDRLKSYPGWLLDTVGYHCDGAVYANDDGTLESLKPSEDTRVNIGDRMGCGIVFEPGVVTCSRTPQLVVIYFTRNGQIIHSKPRLMPIGGFYPTVTLPEKGDKATILGQTPPPFIAEDLHAEIAKWRQLYTDFRFSETIEFTEYRELGLVDLVEVKGRKDVPQILQYVRDRRDSYYFHFKIISIGFTTEFKIGAADGSILTQTEALPHDNINKTFTIHGTYDEGVRIGDTVEVFLDTVEAGRVWQTVVVNGNIVFKEEVCFDSKVTVYPTLCFRNGPIKLQITWPDWANVNEQTKFGLDALPNWRHSKDITINSSHISCTSISDKTSCCNIVSPVPVNKQGAFYFEIKRVKSNSQSSPMFPGIGVTSGTVPDQTKTLTLVKQASSAFFYGTTQSLVTWKGTQQTENRLNDVEVVGCAVTYVDDLYVLTFHCDQQACLSHKMKAPIGGLYPAISFQTGTQGQMFEVDILDTETLEKTIVGEVPEVVDVSELDWRKHADAVVSALPGFEVHKDERFSSIDSVFISHDMKDMQHIDKIIIGLQNKGYKIQTSASSSMETKRTEMDMSSIVLFCLSSASLNANTMLEDLRHVTDKNIPMLPLCFGPVTWPPGGVMKEGLTLFDKYTGVKLDFLDDIGPEQINAIEHHMAMAMGLGLQPVTVQPLKSIVVGDSGNDLYNTDDDDDDDDDEDSDDDDNDNRVADDNNVPMNVTYHADTNKVELASNDGQSTKRNGKSSTCLIL